MTGFPVFRSILIPNNVFIILIPSAPASSHAFAISTIFVTFGVSFIYTGFVVTAFTAFVTSAADFGSVPKLIPPLCTFGQLIFISIIPTWSSLSIFSAQYTYSSIENPLMLATIGFLK